MAEEQVAEVAEAVARLKMQLVGNQICQRILEITRRYHQSMMLVIQLRVISTHSL